ncbi:glycosyltransferase, partial [Streptococcus pneumoniae]|nr:glycosyltransferase [Streptococcus pneumoniae]
ISIVVPVYNVEKYLKKSIESVLNRTYQNIEILLVDDGSTDSSGKICESFSKVDPRIRVFHKENGGLSDARNFGIEQMKGQYVAFIDSDD